ncbi:putative transmembrane protein [Trypanosoma vivax]|nr:putative transmembrane protein [Trypanosoma vivax]
MDARRQKCSEWTPTTTGTALEPRGAGPAAWSPDPMLIVNYQQVGTVDGTPLRFWAKVSSTSAFHICSTVICVLLLTAGNAMQIIGLNFWLSSFPKDVTPGNMTILVVSSFNFSLIFLVVFVLYVCVQRPSLNFATSRRGMWLLFFIGLMDTINSSLVIYAASYTPEIMQALLTSLLPLFSAGMTKWLLNDRRNYCTSWIISSFTLIVAGVITASSYQFARGFAELGDKVWWSVIFFLSVPHNATMNVLQSRYMIEFTRDPTFDNVQTLYYKELVERETAGENQREAEQREGGRAVEDQHPLVSSEDITGYFQQGTDTAVKLVMLSSGTTIQLVLIMLMLPTDALPWWGGSRSVSEVWTNLLNGIKCVLECETNLLHCVVYTAGFTFTYIGAAHLNQQSPTLCSMVGQLSSPITALLLILVPSWNIQEGYTPWYLSVSAIVLLFGGLLIYTIWERKTDNEKCGYERQLKERVMFRAAQQRFAPHVGVSP